MKQTGLEERLFAIVLARLADVLRLTPAEVAYRSLICPGCAIGSTMSDGNNRTVKCPQFIKRGPLSIMGFPPCCPGGAEQNSATERWLFAELRRRGGIAAVIKYCARQDIMKGYSVQSDWQALVDLANKNEGRIEESNEFKVLIMSMECLYLEMNH